MHRAVVSSARGIVGHRAEHGGVDVLLNHAGYGSYGAIEGVDAARTYLFFKRILPDKMFDKLLSSAMK